MSRADTRDDIFLAVRDHRNEEALQAGLSDAEAWIFANDTIDVAELRRLVAAGCPADLIARIIL